MVHTQIKRVVFGTFFSLNLLVVALHASDINRTDVAKVIGAAIVAKVVENRLSGKGSVCPVGLINQFVPVKTHIETQDFFLNKSQISDFPQLNCYENKAEYNVAVQTWLEKNNAQAHYSDQNVLVGISKKEIISVTDSAVHRLGIKIGSIPVHVVSVPDCKQLEKRPWTRALIQFLNTDVFVPGLNVKNALEIAAVLKAATMARPYLPAVPNFSKK